MSLKKIIYKLINNNINSIKLTNTDTYFRDDTNFIEFKNALKFNTSLKHITLSNIIAEDKLPYEHSIALLKTLQNNLFLEYLDFSKNCMYNDYYSEKEDYNSANLTKLIYTVNNFKSGFQYSLNFIDTNLLNCFNKLSDDYINSIRSNILNNMKIFYMDSIIFDILRRCKKLNLSYNCLYNDVNYNDDNLLSKILTSNTNLEELDISYNSILDKKWINSLNNNTTLKILKINEDKHQLKRDIIYCDAYGEEDYGSEGEYYDNKHIKLKQKLFFSILKNNNSITSLELWVDFKEEDKIPDKILHKSKPLDLLIIHNKHYNDLYMKQIFQPFIDNKTIKEIFLVL